MHDCRGRPAAQQCLKTVVILCTSIGYTALPWQDFNPFILGGNSSNVHKKPKVRVRAMATGKSEGFYEPYPGMEI